VRWLAEPGGEAGRAYLAGRGLDEQTIAAFGIGWSGPRGALAQDLPITKLVEAGLMYRREEDGVAVDFFRDRIMFPIRDQAGRVVSFGGRTLGDAQPKYINGPETAVYAKRRMLYGLDKAREAFRLGKPLIVVEGYLDVIAMHSVGETGTVAPLGSALTDEQLDELWRLSPAPILLFDGDAAGQRATGHVMEIALPKLAAQRTLQICTLEAGDDPDGLLKRAGVAALRLVLDGARPLVAALAEALRPAESGRLALAVWRNRIGLAADMIQDAAVCQDHRRALLNFYFEQVGEQWTSTAA
ncbi:MAG TPA: toprim domain-containing protein, partial [Bradyrhizobium sp.]|nr:toprim domain-containing protein [Bradyrhizobium sp.]